MKHTITLLLLLLVNLSILSGQQKKIQLDKVADRFAAASLQNFKELLSIPNDAHYPKDIEKNVQWCEAQFGDRGFRTERLSTPTVPLLLAEKKSRGAQKTVLIYLQIDGQPVDKTRWFQKSPWTPTLKAQDEDGEWKAIPWEKLEGEIDPDWRIFARSASDAKGPVAMFLAALDAAQEQKIQPNYNIKIIMDFEEELGSPHLPPAVEQYREKLASDMLIIFDGPRHISNEPTLTFGARGIATVTLTVHGPRVPQHSGHYGNYAPNPAVRLAQLIASMKDEDGRVTIPGFYDGVELDEATKAILAQVPDDEKQIQAAVGIAETDKVGNNYQEAIQYPSLNVRGMASAWIGGKVRTIVPATATAEIDIRLVPEVDPDRLIRLVADHIKSKGYLLLDREPTEEERLTQGRIAFMRSKISYQAFRTPFDAEVGLWLDRAMHSAFGKAPIKIRNSGGSIPISPFVTTLGIPAVTVPTVNRDNNQHSPNENVRLGNYFEGVRLFLAILGEQL